MFRDPGNGAVLLEKMERGTQSSFRISGTGESFAVTLGTDGSVTTAMNGRGYRIASDGSHKLASVTPSLTDALTQTAMAQLGPGLLAQGRSAREVQSLVAACVNLCEGPDAHQKFLLSKDGARIAVVYPDQPLQELSVEAILSPNLTLTPQLPVGSADLVSGVSQFERAR